MLDIDPPNPPSTSGAVGESGTAQYGHASDQNHGHDHHANDLDDRLDLPCFPQR